MFHLTDRLLAKLIDGSATTSDLQRIRRHIDGCRACARRLEEWRDNFTEVDERFPELSVEGGPLATVTPGGLVMLPGSEPSRRFVTPDLTTLLWIGAVLMALLVGYGASRLRQPSEGMRVATMEETRGIPRPPSPKPSVTPGPATTPPAPVPADAAPQSPTQGAAAASTATDPGPRSSSPSPATPPPTANPSPAVTPLAVTPRFREIGRVEAARRAGGPLRSLPGLKLDHIEVGPASAVPGAQQGIDVIRIVYRNTDGSPLFLDQQRIPTDADGLRSIDDPTLESGETAYGSGPNGVSVASWLDEDGYRLSIAARTPLDSLKKLVPLVQ
jgi:anti-sigma factor RsiW